MTSISREQQIIILRRALSRGVSDAKSLTTALQISQPAFARLWPQAGNDIISFGAARATKYALTRPIREIGSTFPIYRITEQGKQVLFGELIALVNNEYVFTWKEGERNLIRLFLGLPFFLQDLRPQGFLGALVPRENQDLRLDDKVSQWNDEDVLYYLARRGEDVIGNLIVGNESASRYFKQTDLRHVGVIHAHDRDNRYPELSDQVNAGHIGNSSAGGDQPKFTACIMRDGHTPIEDRLHHVIVKFSPPMDTASGRRWADLLICEHLALDTLSRNAMAASKTNMVIAADRVFLEVARFDRVGSAGRLPMVSILGLDGELGAAAESWTYAANLLTNQKKLSEADLDRIRTLDLFGALIGNSDRHQGNLSLSWTLQDRLTLLPSYDMLPMLYRPNSQGEIIKQKFSAAALDKLDLRHLDDTSRMANQFWNAVLEEPRISDDFKEIAREHSAAIAQYANAPSM